MTKLMIIHINTEVVTTSIVIQEQTYFLYGLKYADLK